MAEEELGKEAQEKTDDTGDAVNTVEGDSIGPDSIEEEILDSTVDVPVDGQPVDVKTVPVVEVFSQTGSLGVKKVQVKFLKDLHPRVRIGNDWIGGKEGEIKLVTSMQARILRGDNTVT